MNELRDKGLGLAAISYDRPEILADFSQRHGITFPLLSDAGSATIKVFGLLNTFAEDAVGPGREDPGVADNIHTFVRRRFSYPSDRDLKSIGDALDGLVRLRNHADYKLAPHAYFQTDATPQDTIDQTVRAIALLDAIDGDTTRRAAAIAAIQAAFP